MTVITRMIKYLGVIDTKNIETADKDLLLQYCN